MNGRRREREDEDEGVLECSVYIYLSKWIETRQNSFFYFSSFYFVRAFQCRCEWYLVSRMAEEWSKMSWNSRTWFDSLGKLGGWSWHEVRQVFVYRHGTIYCTCSRLRVLRGGDVNHKSWYIDSNYWHWRVHVLYAFMEGFTVAKSSNITISLDRATV